MFGWVGRRKRNVVKKDKKKGRNRGNTATRPFMSFNPKVGDHTTAYFVKYCASIYKLRIGNK